MSDASELQRMVPAAARAEDDARPSLMLVIGWRVVAIAVALVILGIAVVFTQLSQTADANRNQLLVGWADDSRMKSTPARPVSVEQITYARIL